MEKEEAPPKQSLNGAPKFVELALDRSLRPSLGQAKYGR